MYEANKFFLQYAVLFCFVFLIYLWGLLVPVWWWWLLAFDSHAV